MFHGYTEGFRWDKGGRLYSQPQGPACYQNQSEATRLQMRINDERVIEIDFSSSYLTIFYSLCDQQLDNTQDAYAGILGPTALDRQVAKFWINASFGNSKLLTKWTEDLVTRPARSANEERIIGLRQGALSDEDDQGESA